MLRFANWSLETLILWALAILPAIVLHEYAHAAVAYRLGDPTPRYDGRLSLNPAAHIDPIGALMLFFFGFGWARPVGVSPAYFRDPRRGMMAVAVAGPLANVAIAWVSNLALDALQGIDLTGLDPMWWVILRGFARLMLFSVQINLLLAAFNLIPIPPLDGSRILAGLVSSRQAVALARMEAYGPFLLVLLIMSGISRLLLSPVYQVLAFLIGAGRV